MHTKQRKIVVLGYRGVGKTSLVMRHVNGQVPDIYSPTIENTYTTAVTKRLHEYHLQVVDTAGLDDLSLIPSVYAMNIDGYILVYSIQSAESFRVVQAIYQRLLATTGLLVGKFPVVLVANKIDLKPPLRPRIELPPWYVNSRSRSAPSLNLPDVTLNESEIIPRAVSCEAGRSLAAKWQAAYVETSAIDNVNVAKIFELIAERLTEADDGQYLMSLIGLNKQPSWGRRRFKSAQHKLKSKQKRRASDSWWRRLTCTSSTSVSESQL